MILVKLLSARSRSAINQSGQASLIYAPPLLSGQRLQEERLDAHRAPTKGNNFLCIPSANNNGNLWAV